MPDPVFAQRAEALDALPRHSACSSTGRSMEDTMKHATRINALARQAGGAVFSIAHGAVLSFGLMGMAYVATGNSAPIAVS